MLNNKEFKYMIVAAAVLTVAASICGYAFCGVSAFFIMLMLGITLTTMFAVTTIRRYKDLDALNSYLVSVLAGGEALNILDQEEGEISLLKTNIYKATTTLNYQKNLLTKDKVALSNAIADISHQLKTPLTSMIVMNDLLKSEDDKDKRIEFLQTQSNQLDRMNWLIQTLLKLSKIDAGTIAMKTEKVAVDALVREVIKPFEIQMELKDITCSCIYLDASKDNNVAAANFDINCDINWTIEAIQNIVKNCIEHMESGGTLTISASDTNIYNEIIIEDTGCGISTEDLPHIFERFYKGKNAGKNSVGIGLALAKTIMNGQHGDIVVESTEGAGTKFSVKFYKTII
ncbi:sensor histidine kinase [Butyrivibrio sp. YAB3001]|uniref:sensor histidine kinase n=1 Tax=Butyrivibrio sp. YAB3001 TaxID=1520812 RepID=UPI0008F68E8B|nr:HAMP domain-containing sensor histidine kinase [Butyrivibrio sp. YAB3001]SFC47866.1 Signal transduction histidine kinase [Butyrivibrio sp. YAB3001]